MKLSDLLVPATKFSKFRCDTYKKFSANAGILYPVWFNLLNPGESASIDLRNVIRSWPVESPLMGSFKVRFVTAAFNLKNYASALEGYKRSFDWRSTTLPYLSFYYPNDAVQSDYYFDRLLSEPESNSIGRDDLASSQIKVNLVHYLSVHDCSLADYLSYPSGWIPTVTNYVSNSGQQNSFVDKSFLPFMCYYDFYRNYLVNPQETYFPIFTTGSEVMEFPNDNNGVNNCLTTQSLLSMFPLATLDDFFVNTHNYYDGTNLQPINDNGSVHPFISFLRWKTLPSLVKGSQNILSDSLCNVFSSVHGGLVSTMYDSDINTQWMSVDNFNKFDEVRVNTQSVSGATYSSFMDIVKASSLWDFITKSVNSDGTYGDFIGNQFGVSVKGDMNIPQIVHVYDTLLTFDDITSQSDTVTSPDSPTGAVVGQQFGVGRSYGQSNYFKVVNKDGNYVMLMTFMWITPQVCYSKGLHHLHSIVKFSDLYQPSFDNYSMQARLQEQVNCVVPTYSDISSRYFDTVVYNDSYNPVRKPLIEVDSVSANYPLGYQPAWSDYKTDVDSVHGLFRSRLNYYTIIRDVPLLSSGSLITEPNSVASAYVWYTPSLTPVPALDAKTYTLPFAIQEEDPFQVQLRVSCTITRAMSKNTNPNIK